MSVKKLAILVGGGPAPGINAVIGSATIAAQNRGMDVIGVYDGFKWLCSEKFRPDEHTTPLTRQGVSRIHFAGGSILRTARTSLLDDERLKTSTIVAPDEHKVQQAIKNLRSMGVDALLTIGGDDTALSARFICDATDGELRGVHVPKTIDNDLPLPHDVPTFGFSTAQHMGTQLVKNLMRDSQTTGRWYLVETMGRRAGWLTLAIGMAAGATVTLIPEEYPAHTTLQHLADTLEVAIIKRKSLGRPDGVALVAEGLAYCLGDAQELERMLGRAVPLDAAGHPRLSEFPLAQMLKRELESRFKARKQSITLVTHTLGYELRCADPTPFDMAYCRSLAYFAITLLHEAGPDTPRSSMVSVVNGNVAPINLHDMIDPQTNRTRIRTVDIRSDIYRVARAYMIRLERGDLENPEVLARLAAEVKLTPEEFVHRYGPCATRLVNGVPAT